ncbi:MAG: phenylalanine--tRNA ligase subunit alpha, partial [Nitrosomonadales bacterium]
MNNLENLLNEATSLFNSIDNTIELEHAKARYLGKSGVLTEMLRGLGKLSPEERPVMGGQINRLKEILETKINCRRELILFKEMEAQLAGEALDVTLSGRGLGMGGLHPITRTLERIESL